MGCGESWSGLRLPSRVSELAGDFGLAEATPSYFHAVFLSDVTNILILVVVAFYLIVALLGDGASGTTGNAVAAFIIDIK